MSRRGKSFCTEGKVPRQLDHAALHEEVIMIRSSTDHVVRLESEQCKTSRSSQAASYHLCRSLDDHKEDLW